MGSSKLSRLWPLLLTVSILLPAFGCSSPSGDSEELSRVKEETAEAADAAGDYISEQRRAAVEKLQDAYDDVSERIARFRETNSEKLTEAQKELLEDLEKKQARIEEQLAQARTAAEDGWEELKGDISASVDDLDEAFGEIRSRFKE